MLKITLACAGGMSSSLLVKRLEQAAQAIDLEISVRAIGQGRIAQYREETDILLIAPQVKYTFKGTQKQFPDLKMMVIESRSYGMMDAEKILQAALAL